ncbi:hypothetical protein F383_30752 [Gossypium arboreum]|uniref:Uncharacterized protein n=1 Tax=Gossypium arboreum TaxID=29729 RepID=A0A0B0N2V3_GOSAR|nr:hypothetical protein F383_32078 [Gossypium arboreum]KHG24700.1 hypothetical protein F383_30752 [Gossypium arboreum]
MGNLMISKIERKSSSDGCSLSDRASRRIWVY